MPPHKCCYYRCENTSEQKSMFRFPWNDPLRLQEWLNNCGNMSIAHLPPERLRARYICIDHFDTKFVRNMGGTRKRLLRTAVPEPYVRDECGSPPRAVDNCGSPPGSPYLKVMTPKKVYENKMKRLEIPQESSEEKEIFISTTPKKRKRVQNAEEDSPKCKKLKTILVDTNKRLKREIMKNKQIKNKLKKINIVDIISKHKFSSETSKMLAIMQLRPKNSKKPWGTDQRKYCMSMYYKSPCLYKFMVNTGATLAAPSTIQRWLQETNCLPGINEEVFENIKSKFEDKPIKERACTVCFDEMTIMVDLDYTNKYDFIEGFEDFGGGDRKQIEARHALVLVARGIYANWKIPLAYFLSSKTVNPDRLEKIIHDVIEKLFDCNLLPKATVCDQATTNVKAIKKLGASVDYPFFFINGRKIYAIFDVPHLIKNIRTNLIAGDFHLNGNEISFSDIIKIYNIDKNNKSKSLHKLTPAHINPNNFQKMKVKLATQVLSNSVAAAIKTAFDSGELKSSTAQNTSDFVKLCNDLFDCLNSKNKLDPNPYRCAITNNQNTIVNQTLIKGKETFSKLSKISYSKKNVKRFSRPACFDGMIQTINAVQQLSSEEFTPGTGVKFINTYRLNQDVIENLFGIYRFKGGCNKNPSAKSLRSMFRSSLLNSLMNFDKTNCESDQEVFLDTQQSHESISPVASTSSNLPQGLQSQQSQSSRSQQFLSHESQSHESQSQESQSQESQSQESQSQESQSHEVESQDSADLSLEICSVVYFAGWLGRSCIEKFDCPECKKILIKDEVDLTDKTQLLLINKTYSNIVTPTLKSPTDFLFQLVNKVLDFYNQNINGLAKMNLITSLMANFKNVINIPGDYHDMNHFDYLIKKLLEVKIRDYCKNRKKSLQSSSKLRILQNQ